MSATFDVVPVIEQGLDGLADTHEVQIALTPNAQRLIVRAFARAFHVAAANGTPLGKTMHIAGQIGVDEHQVAALDAAQSRLGSAWAVLTVSPDEATTLGRALLEAAEPPTVCADCDHLIDTDMAGNTCARCTETPRGLRSA